MMKRSPMSRVEMLLGRNSNPHSRTNRRRTLVTSAACIQHPGDLELELVQGRLLIGRERALLEAWREAAGLHALDDADILGIDRGHIMDHPLAHGGVLLLQRFVADEV